MLTFSLRNNYMKFIFLPYCYNAIGARLFARQGEGPHILSSGFFKTNFATFSYRKQHKQRDDELAKGILPIFEGGKLFFFKFLFVLIRCVMNSFRK